MKAFYAGLVALSLLLLSCPASGHGKDGIASAKPETIRLAEDLTVELVDARSAYVRASRRQQAARLAALESIARERHDLLALLMDSNPSEVLRLALPRGIQAAFPARTQRYFEREVTEEGTLTVIHVDMPGEGFDRFLYSIDTPTGKHSLHFAAQPTNLLTGSRIRVHGLRIDSSIALASGGPGGSVHTLAAAYPNTFGVQHTLLILVNFSDQPSQPFTPAQGASVVFGDTSSYDMETSYQQTSLTGDVTPWYTIATTSAGCDPDTIATQALQAATGGGFNLGNYTRYVFAFPANSCTWWGLGTVGGNPSRAWIQAQFGFTLPVVAHEMGHNFGLRHSHSLDCGDAVVGTIGCTTAEYGDVFDVMGGGANGSSPHFNAFQKELLGWLGTGLSPPLTTVQNNGGGGQFSIGNLEAARSGTTRALKIGNTVAVCNIAPSEWYYVEKREAVGFDSFLGAYPSVTAGVVVHRVTAGDSDSSYLLDMTPQTSSWYDIALPTGSTFTDPVTGLTIKPVAVGQGYADVSVTYAADSCVNAPGVKLDPATTQWRIPGQTATYEVTVTNTDSCLCATTAYNVSATVPAGWTASNAATGVLAPGASAFVNIDITVAGNAVPAFYNIPIVATSQTNPAKSGSANAAMSVTIPTQLISGIPVGPITANKGEGLLYSLVVPPGKTSVTFNTSGGTGDADLYVSFNAMPSTSLSDCRSEGPTTVETCTIPSPQAGIYYVFLYAYSNISGVSLTGQYFPADVALPAISVGDATVSEGNSGTKLATFTVSLSQASASPVTFDIATAPGTASPPSDFIAKSTIGQSIAAGQTSTSFSVTIKGDTATEGNETFTANLANVTGATVADGQGQGRINNDDLALLSIGDVSVTEGDNAESTATFVVSLSSPTPNPVTFDIATSNGSATAGSDYVTRSQPGRYMDAGRSSLLFEVNVDGDALAESNETFNVTISNVTGATLADGAAVGTIVNDDGAALRVRKGAAHRALSSSSVDPY